MGTLGERLGWVLAHRTFSSRRALVQATGQSGAHLALVAKGERGLGAHAARAIATAAGVDLRRFVTGKGTPDGAAKEHTRLALSPDPCPRREQAPWPSWGHLLPEVAAALRLERPAQEWSLEDWLARENEPERLVKAFEETCKRSSRRRCRYAPRLGVRGLR